MINPFVHVNWWPDTRELRTFAKSLLIGFPIIALICLVASRITGGAWSLGLPLKIGGYGAGAGLVFMLVPFVAKPFYLVWYALSCTIGLIVSNVLLSTFYYTIFTGIALLRRAFSCGPIRKRFDKSAKSYWIDAGPPPDPQRYYSQY
jgi:hypothetical protein